MTIQRKTLRSGFYSLSSLTPKSRRCSPGAYLFRKGTFFARYAWGHQVLPAAHESGRLDFPALQDGQSALLHGQHLKRICSPCSSLIERRSEEHTSELQSLMRNSYAVFCLKKKNIYI